MLQRVIILLGCSSQIRSELVGEWQENLVEYAQSSKTCLSPSSFPVLQYGFAQGLSKSTKVELCQGLGRMLKAGWCLQSLQHPRTKMSVAGLRVAQEGTQLEERRGQEHGRRNQPVFHHRACCA